MKKIAIIGSSSFLGKNLVSELTKFDFELSLFSRNANLDLEIQKFDYPKFIPDFDIFLIFDVVVYCVAGGVQSSVKYPVENIYELNSFIPIRLINYLNVNNFKGKIITFGSYFEIGEENQFVYLNENDVANSSRKISNDYALSKRLLSRFSISDIVNINHFHIILPSIYGKNENSNRLIPYIVNSLKEGRQLQLTLGDQVRQFLHIKDVVNFVISFIIEKDLPAGVYNLTSDDFNYVKDVFEIIFNSFNSDFKDSIGRLERKDESMKILLLHDAKAREYGWLPYISLFDGISEYL